MNPAQPQPPKQLRCWTTSEEHQLIHLRESENKKFEDIAPVLGRTTNAIQNRYSTIKQKQFSSAVDWTPALDASIIDGRRRCLPIREIAKEVKIPHEAISERWNTLRFEKKVPEEVLAIWRRKRDVVFSPKEDEMILQLWMQGKGDEDIVRMVNFKGKSQENVRDRRVELVNGSSLLYLKMLGVGQGRKDENETALSVAIGPKRYGWMK
jgi:hypothetical protein